MIRDPAIENEYRSIPKSFKKFSPKNRKVYISNAQKEMNFHTFHLGSEFLELNIKGIHPKILIITNRVIKADINEFIQFTLRKNSKDF
jgi:hypothetical protein